MKSMAILLSVLCLVGCQMPNVKPDELNQGAQIEQILTQVQRALDQVASQISVQKLKDVPPFSSVKLSLETELKRSQDNSFTLFVVTLGNSSSNATTQTLVLNLTPPDPAKAAIAPVALDEQLARAILQAVTATQKEARGSPPIKLSSLTASVKFVVARSTKGGLKWEVAPVSTDLGRTTARTSTHTIEITFKNADPKKAD